MCQETLPRVTRTEAIPSFLPLATLSQQSWRLPANRADINEQ